MTCEWYEVWADEGLGVPYLLLLLYAAGRSDPLVIIDPKEGGKIIFSAATYREAELWLLEDEYTRVEGRMSDDRDCGE